MAVTHERLPAKDWEMSLLQDLAGYSHLKAAQTNRLLSGSTGIHLAIFNEPFLSYILQGKKTVESRFSANRCAPYGKVAPGDLLLLKKCSGPIVAVCTVDCVWDYELDGESLAEIKRLFSAAICADSPAFWEARKRARYATLMRIRDVVPTGPIDCEKRDRRGWVVLQDAGSLPFHLEG